ncbi:hypothetical protein diail_7204 [Diaporthe ilicicola]|nr:hypothetical protein diail_7204 [Diaporthe ilicicola]
MTSQTFQGRPKPTVNNASQTFTLPNMDLFQMTPEDMDQDYQCSLLLQPNLGRHGPTSDSTSLNPSSVHNLNTSCWRLKSPTEHRAHQSDHELMFTGVQHTDNNLWSPVTSVAGDSVNFLSHSQSRGTIQSPGVLQPTKSKQLEPTLTQQPTPQPTPSQLSGLSSRSVQYPTESEDEREQDRNSGTESIYSTDEIFQTVLHIAAEGGHEGLIVMLLESGIVVDERDSEGNTALHRATQNGRMRSVEKLLEHGANPNSVNAMGCTPIHIAASLGSVEMVQVLMHYGADLFQKARGNPSI